MPVEPYTDSAAPPAAPWRQIFQSHLANNTSGKEFTLATIGHDADGRQVPHARTCGFRGFWPDPELRSKALEELERATASEGRNPRVYESDMLSFTTDVRMDKVHEMKESGYVVEAVFWLRDVANQWRVRGQAFVIGAAEGAPGERFARSEILKGMRLRADRAAQGNNRAVESEWSWEREVTTYFANHTPVLRGSFKGPSPGRPRSQQPADPALQLGQLVTDLHDATARKHFRVVVIRPTEVERLDLTDYEKPLRWKWTIVDNTDPAQDPSAPQQRWVEVELWP